MFYHKACLKCVECGKGPDADAPMMLGPQDNDDVFVMKSWNFTVNFVLPRSTSCLL